MFLVLDVWVQQLDLKPFQGHRHIAKEAVAVAMALGVATTAHQQGANLCGFNPSSICGLSYCDFGKKDETRKWHLWITILRDSSVYEALGQVLADSDSEEI